LSWAVDLTPDPGTPSLVSSLVSWEMSPSPFEPNLKPSQWPSLWPRILFPL